MGQRPKDKDIGGWFNDLVVKLRQGCGNSFASYLEGGLYQIWAAWEAKMREERVKDDMKLSGRCMG